MYILAGIEYKTKIATTKAIQQKIKDNDICIINPEHNDYIFFDNLINLHEYADDKIGCGIKHFEIRKNVLNYKERSIFIIRHDNTECIFSFHKCLGKKFNDLLIAMREAISPFTMEYKKCNKLICINCNNEKLNYSDYHVDHNSIPFSTITKNYLKETKKIIPNLFDKDKKSYLCTFKNEDDEFKEDWINYHNSKADYQILCNKCNIKKSNN